jgi:hypothetical protein
VQERTIAGYALMHGMTIDQTFVERGVSGSKPLSERPQGTALLAAITRRPEEGGELVSIPEQQAAIARMRMLRAEGVSLRTDRRATHRRWNPDQSHGCQKGPCCGPGGISDLPPTRFACVGANSGTRGHRTRWTMGRMPPGRLRGKAPGIDAAAGSLAGGVMHTVHNARITGSAPCLISGRGRVGFPISLSWPPIAGGREQELHYEGHR